MVQIAAVEAISGNLTTLRTLRAGVGRGGKKLKVEIRRRQKDRLEDRALGSLLAEKSRRLMAFSFKILPLFQRNVIRGESRLWRSQWRRTVVEIQL